MKIKNKKIYERIFTIFSLLLLLITMTLFVIVIVSRINNQAPQIFGYSLHFVVSDSMEDEIKVGDLVIGKKVDITDIKVGDDILFVSTDPSLNGKTIVHRVRSIDDSDGIRKVYTYGIKYNKDDNVNYPVTSIIGKVSTVSSFWGKLFNPVGAVFIVIIIVVLSFLFFSVNSFIKAARDLKKEKTNELNNQSVEIVSDNTPLSDASVTLPPVDKTDIDKIE